jgi:hypothetical protein
MSATIDPANYNVTKLEPKTKPKGKPRVTSYSLKSLMKADFPSLKWAIPGYIPEGLSILAGRQKLGKSRLALDFACAVASGGYAMGSVKCQQGAVLFLDLENGPRRAQQRLKDAMPNWETIPDGQFQIEFEAKALDRGLMADLDAWQLSVQNPRLVIIDVLQRVKPVGKGNQNAYESDYVALTDLQTWATHNGISVVVIHHTRKGGADDPTEALSGSNGLAACADTILVLDKVAGDVTLYVRGRDVEEKTDALESVGGGWSLLGEAREVHRSDERSTVLEALRGSSEPMNAREVSDLTGHPYEAVRKLLTRMGRAGEVTREKRGLYSAPPLSQVSQSPNHYTDPENKGDLDDE